MPISVAELAGRIGATFEGDGSAVLCRMASLSEAGEGALSFLSNKRYAPQVATTKATAVIVGADWKGESSAKALIRSGNPDKAFSHAAPFLSPPPPERAPGIHPTAVVSPKAVLGANVHVGPFTVIEGGARIGDGSVVEAQCFIGEDVEIGAGAHLYPGVKIRERVRIGARFIAHCGVVIGSDGFGYSIDILPGGVPQIEKIPQVGIVKIGDDVEIGSNTTIDRARFGETRIGNCVKIDNLVQIGHNVRIGDFSGVIAQAGIAGSTTVGSGVRIWAQAGLSGHLHIGDGAQVGPQCGLSRDVAPGEYVIGTPQQSMRELVSLVSTPRQVAKLKERIKALEARIEAISGEKQ
ncbi:MAG: UDP-3-O-(3-hydroxymyristoyl)glucosamine N-acyltransferase [Kiritimatiellae bacterium]|nr:UDP-3-O-(3-hydroxymyristoyl)glucosamine N-acyltransferase [Kiritimatiellia bacterium]